jgi:hypothetical protein
MIRASTLTAIAFVAACGSSDAATAPEPAASGPSTLADIIELDDVGFYQAVKITLFHHGETLEPKAPIVPGRPALVRISARAPKPATVKDRRFLASLALHLPGREDVVITDVPRRIVPLQEAALWTTFNFEIDPALVTKGMSFDVTIRDATNTADAVTFQTFAIEPGPLAPVLKVKFVPVRYEGDGSGRLPKLDHAALEGYRRALFKLYPVAAVDIGVRDELAWPLPVWADGAGWDRLLSAIIETRADDSADDDVYYVAVVSPAPSQGEFCSEGGCVLGMAPRAELSDIGLRVAMVLGYESRSGEGTLAQELAHAMGRGHAPCGVTQNLDRKYPYADATIGVFGWDVLDKEIHDPEGGSRDFMSYCHPVWTSDYTFAALYQRMVDVERTKRPAALAPDDVAKTIAVAKDGTQTKGPRVRVQPGARRGARELVGTGGSIVLE